MATGERKLVSLLWSVEARLAALLPDLLVFRKPRGLEPELTTAQGVLLGVHVTGEGEGRCVARPACHRGGRWFSAPRGCGAYGLAAPGRAKALFNSRPLLPQKNFEGHFQNRRTPLRMIWLSP